MVRLLPFIEEQAAVEGVAEVEVGRRSVSLSVATRVDQQPSRGSQPNRATGQLRWVCRYCADRFRCIDRCHRSRPSSLQERVD